MPKTDAVCSLSSESEHEAREVPATPKESQKHAIKVLKSKTKVVSRALGKVGRYRSNSENTDIFLGFGGSIRNLCNLQLSYTSIIYTRLGYMHYCIYI